MIRSASLLASFMLAMASAHLTFRATPRFAVETITGSVTLTCRLPVTPASVYRMLDLQHTDVNGTVSQLARMDPQNGLTLFGNDRVTAEGNIEDEESLYYLTATISEPIEEDSGEYECKFIYITPEANPHSFVSSQNVTVTGEPTVNFTIAEEVPAMCECDTLWEEINTIKAALASSPASAGSSNPGCRASFSAYFTTNAFFPSGSKQTLVFDATKVNAGSAYNTETGEFTAPCDGQYYFSVTLRSSTDLDAGYMDGVLVAADIPVSRTSVYVNSPVSNTEMASTGSVVSLKAGEKVKVMVDTTSTGSFQGQEYSTFTGFYIVS